MGPKIRMRQAYMRLLSIIIDNYRRAVFAISTLFCVIFRISTNLFGRVKYKARFIRRVGLVEPLDDSFAFDSFFQ